MIGISKKLMCIVLCAVMMLSVLSVVAFAEGDNGDISTYVVNASTLTISSGVAKCNVKYTPINTSVDKLIVVMTLQKYSSSTWTNYYSSTTTIKDNAVNLTKYIDVTSGSYRLLITITPYVGSTKLALVTFDPATASC